jgi:hypothetical protein
MELLVQTVSSLTDGNQWSVETFVWPPFDLQHHLVVWTQMQSLPPIYSICPEFYNTVNHNI